jgi:hypothetical protein
MTTRLRIALIAAGAALVALRPTLVQSPRVKGTSAPAEPDRPQLVRVEHELVTATVIEEPAPRPQRTAVRRPPAQRQPPARAAGFVSRTRQLLLGDGRYKPEPFPRVDR